MPFLSFKETLPIPDRVPFQWSDYESIVQALPRPPAQDQTSGPLLNKPGVRANSQKNGIHPFWCAIKIDKRHFRTSSSLCTRNLGAPSPESHKALSGSYSVYSCLPIYNFSPTTRPPLFAFCQVGQEIDWPSSLVCFGVRSRCSSWGGPAMGSLLASALRSSLPFDPGYAKSYSHISSSCSDISLPL